MPSNHLILCRSLLLLPSIFPSIRVFSNGSVLHIRWPKYWSFRLSINLSSVNFQDWFLLVWTGWISLQSETFKILLQQHSSKASVLSCSAFFMVQLSHSYMTTGKTTALTIQTFVSKVMSRLFNTLSRFVIVFLQNRMSLLISWRQAPSTVVLEPPPPNSLSLFPLFLHLFAMKWWDWMPWS